MFSTTPRRERDGYPAARSVIISAWAVPVLIIGQFAMVAVVPVVIALIGTLRDARLRPLRCFAVALAAAYAVPLGIWRLRSDPAQSLSKDINPFLAALVVVAAVALAVAHHLLRRRYGTDDTTAAAPAPNETNTSDVKTGESGQPVDGPGHGPIPGS
ncbi:hypothetical protein [Nocardia colli]|uniref:hypothetical protein n=1 Tax=Nocardia colli TaxID=2545717 RepID=UPI001CC80399|nr:hypothetical protein [Nocardia colli]